MKGARMTGKCQQLCQNCPLVPKGVTAELESVEVVHTERSPRLGVALFTELRIVARATRSTRPGTDPGDRAVVATRIRGEAAEGVRHLFSLCGGPVQVPLWLRWLMQPASCGAFGKRLF